MYGAINFTIILPMLVAFTHIIFSATNIFQNYYPILFKIVIFQSALHQLIFVLSGSLRFSVGSV